MRPRSRMRRITVSVAASCALAAGGHGGAGANENVTLLSNLDLHSGYADVWGFEKDGVFVAILCAQEGTSFVNVTDPVNPQQLLFLPGPVSIWRDAKTYGDYCYIVTDAGGAGLQIVDLSNPLIPVPQPGFTAAFATAHNIFIDTDTGVLYAAGADFLVSNCTDMLDLTQNPISPGIIGCFNDYYLHDIYVRDGIGYGAAINTGFVSTLDMSSLPNVTELDRRFTARQATHNTWTTPDQQYVLTTDERAAGHLQIWDASDPTSIQFVSDWRNPEEPGSSIHNVHVEGRYAYCSWYTAGLQVIDIADPANPVRAGWYDTHPGLSGFAGAFGCYPFASNGLIYISDMQTGLYVFRLDAPVSVAAGGPPIVSMGPAVPNPFRSGARIAFSLREHSAVTIDVLDASGRRVRRLLDGAMGAGAHDILWDGRVASGRSAAPGVYFVRLETPAGVSGGKLVRAE